MDYSELTGRLTVQRGFGLTDHLIALKINQTCYVKTKDYSRNVISVTVCKLRKRGYDFIVKRRRRGKRPVEEVKVTRIG